MSEAHPMTSERSETQVIWNASQSVCEVLKRSWTLSLLPEIHLTVKIWIIYTAYNRNVGLIYSFTSHFSGKQRLKYFSVTERRRIRQKSTHLDIKLILEYVFETNIQFQLPLGHVFQIFTFSWNINWRWHTKSHNLKTFLYIESNVIKNICEYAMVAYHFILLYAFLVSHLFSIYPIYSNKKRICIVFAMQNLAIYRYTMGLNSNMNPIERGCAGTHTRSLYGGVFFIWFHSVMTCGVMFIR